MSDTTTTTTEKITIPMSERRPLSVTKAEWPLIASAKAHDGKVACQANRNWAIKVRQHEDGRTVVYGYYSSNWQNERGSEGGFLLTADEAKGEELIRTIRRVAGIIGRDELGQDCISDLPAEEL